MKKMFLLIAVCLIAACDDIETGPIEPDTVVTDRPGDGSFVGKAGTGWSDSMLQRYVFPTLCGPNGKIAELNIRRDEQGIARFSGHCETSA